MKHTGQSLKAVEDALERDNFMTPERAKEFGLIDHVGVVRGAPEQPSSTEDKSE